MSRKATLLLAGLLAGARFGLAADARPFTLEQVLSPPYPSDLVSSKSGGSIAWVFDIRGARNIWVAEPPEYRGRAVTAFAGDNGQEISDLAFSPDGKSILFVRGGDANRASEIPNPGSDPAGATQAVFVVALAGGEPRRIADGRSPAFSPRGDRVAYVSKDKVWSAPLASPEKPTQAFQARGDCGNLRFSPDGSLLAFVSRRDDHSYVGVFDDAGKTVRYLDPGVDSDAEPAWSPDGKRLAFLRVPASKELRRFLRPHREGPPWSIRVADVASGKGTEIFRAAPGRGSVFREIVSRDQISWLDSDRILFPWEKDSWTHLYSVPAAGGPPTLLTPGEFEVEYVQVGTDRKTVLYNSNQNDIDRRHLWKVGLAGDRPVAVTTGDGLEWSPVAVGSGSIAFVRSGARRPPTVVVKVGAGNERDATPGSIPAEFPESALVTPEPVIFSATDGVPIHGQLFRPAGLRAGERRPAVVFFHGGSRRQMLLGWHYMYYYRNAYAFNQYLASRGYVVLTVNYRSGIGYGMAFREATNFGAAGASEYADVAGAGLYLRGRPDVEGDRIALWGGSYGGYLTALGLARGSDLFAAGVDLHGVHNWGDWYRAVEGEDDRAEAAAARLAFESSPMADVKTWRSPVLLIHGDDDRNVPFQQSVDLAEALRAQGVPFEQLVFPDEVHDFLMQAHWIEAYRAAEDFLGRHLKK